MKRKLAHYHCSVCPRVSAFPTNIIRHEATLHKIVQPGLFTLSCPVCSYLVLHRSEYVRHITRHRGEPNLSEELTSIIEADLEEAVKMGFLVKEKSERKRPALAAIVKKTMEVDKLKRYSCMDDLREALSNV